MVQIFVAVTDWDWFDFLRGKPEIDEVNFWQPGGNTEFRALEPGELFLFKLHAPRNVISGGGIFFRSLRLPISLTWETFGEKNGCSSLEHMRNRIERYRQTADSRNDFSIGCRILTQPFFWPEHLWLAAPQSWARQIVTGKTYDTADEEGRRLWDAIEDRNQFDGLAGLNEPAARYGDPVLIKPRLGQGAFRIAVTDAYDRRCSVTGERTLPVLEAAHIRPYADGGAHDVRNGLLLRRDLHVLFDLGYATVTAGGCFEVSRKIKEEYENGREYYAMHGRVIREPGEASMRPSRDLLEWHNTTVFRG